MRLINPSFAKLFSLILACSDPSVFIRIAEINTLRILVRSLSALNIMSDISNIRQIKRLMF